MPNISAAFAVSAPLREENHRRGNKCWENQPPPCMSAIHSLSAHYQNDPSAGAVFMAVRSVVRPILCNFLERHRTLPIRPCKRPSLFGRRSRTVPNPARQHSATVLRRQCADNEIVTPYPLQHMDRRWDAWSLIIEMEPCIPAGG